MQRTKKEMTDLYKRHVDTVYRVCFTYMRGNKMDLEDAVQDAFIALMRSKKIFESHEHEKAWLIVTSSNICKNMLKKKFKTDIPFEEQYQNPFIEEDNILQDIIQLPVNERMSIYLYYYEGYKAKEIGKILHKKQSTIWSYLHNGREALKEILREYAK